eukprot:TRINITY_DN4039_c0_g1_i1.p1 TRINITY_DN4039_c0_g1~~TRINITY_DN4039_c0_g1_i1.p1  ORF type:complete len:1528 (+),score=372.55 TRINITY_DN4039_c0_g1_i1:37-4584(+)
MKEIIFFIDHQFLAIEEGLNEKIYSMERGTTIRFFIPFDTPIVPMNPIMKWNYPLDNQTFEREKYYTVQRDGKYDPLNWISIPKKIDTPGVFTFYFEHELNKGKEIKYSFLVPPKLMINGKQLPLDCVKIQTVLSKCMGKLERWEKILAKSSDYGYNMIHFTPINELGSSNSAYSLKEKSIDNRYFDKQNLTENEKYSKFEDTFKKLHKNHGLLSMTDIVLNHVSPDSEWLKEHPECGYNLENSPHLIKAYELDYNLQKFGEEIVKGKYENRGLPKEITSIEHIQLLLSIFKEAIWKEILKPWEYLVIDVEVVLEQFEEESKSNKNLKFKGYPKDCEALLRLDYLKTHALLNRKNGKRYSFTLDIEKLLELYYNPKETLETNLRVLKGDLDHLNLLYYQKVDGDLETICSSIEGGLKYERLELKKTMNDPLFPRYFTSFKDKNNKDVALAHNGWMYTDDPLLDFASQYSEAYYLRRVIVWEDCIKLRYGEKYEDNPYLWKRMEEYVVSNSKLFNALRIDNAHSTPIHVARYLLDKARKVNPEIYICAELFSCTPAKCAHYVSQLGIQSLIKESMYMTNASHFAHELNTTRKRHKLDFLPHLGEFNVINPTPVSYIFFDCTHDNEVPNQKRTARDTLPNSIITSMACTSIGSAKSYDLVLPEQLNVVFENRIYPSQDELKYDGMQKPKSVIYGLHDKMFKDNYKELSVYGHHDIVIATRSNPFTHSSIIAICHKEFSMNGKAKGFEKIKARGRLSKIHLAGKLEVDKKHYKHNDSIITGLHNTFIDFSDRSAEDHPMFSLEYTHSGGTLISLKDFVPSSVLVLQFEPDEEESQLIPQIVDMLDKPIDHLFDQISLEDMNVLLYRSDPEEYATIGWNSYTVSGMEKFSYCGISSCADVFHEIFDHCIIDHPLMKNLEEGDWFIDYHLGRLDQRSTDVNGSSLKKVQDWLRDICNMIKRIPRVWVGKLFGSVILKLYKSALVYCSTRMSPFSSNSGEFVFSLSMGSVILFSHVPNCPLRTELIQKENSSNKIVGTLAAGLPHFSNGFMRSWGRDTFISFRGIFLVTGRFDEAVETLRVFASCTRHGLIPNLLDGGRNPRYNARDATWFFLQAIQDLWTFDKARAEKFLSEKILRFFPYDHREDHLKKYVDWDGKGNVNAKPIYNTLAEIIQEILQKHAKGISFREWNAGEQLDRDMSEKGFNVSIHFDLETGFVSGGSPHNCGTWMDKMGSSEKAKNKGIPSTPRDGSPIEIIGLLKSTVRWLSSLNKGIFPFDGVEIISGSQKITKTKLSYQDWNDKIQKNFESHFYVPLDPNEDKNYFVTKSLNRRGIYKDCFGSNSIWADYQLRPNASIAMCVAPELFSPDNAKSMLNIMEENLLSTLGMRTLDPSDWSYRPNYINGIDSEEYSTSKGFNYHNGPEWLWLTGYFLRAKFIFKILQEKNFQNEQRGHLYKILAYLQNHYKEMENNEYLGLPELTNKNNSRCEDSCRTQAWSIATLLDTFQDIYQFMREKNLIKETN